MLNNLRFELLKCGFDDMRAGVVVKEYSLALAISSFQTKGVINAVELENVQFLAHRGVTFEHFPVPILPNSRPRRTACSCTLQTISVSSTRL